MCMITLYVLNHPPSNIHAPYYENDNIVDNHHDHIDPKGGEGGRAGASGAGNPGKLDD